MFLAHSTCYSASFSLSRISGNSDDKEYKILAVAQNIAGYFRRAVEANAAHFLRNGNVTLCTIIKCQKRRWVMSTRTYVRHAG